MGDIISNNCCLIISGFENKTEIDRDSKIREINESIDFQSIKDFYKKGIHFTGMIDYNFYELGQIDVYKYCLQNIYMYRQKILNLILESNVPVDITTFKK